MSGFDDDRMVETLGDDAPAPWQGERPNAWRGRRRRRRHHHRYGQQATPGTPGYQSPYAPAPPAPPDAQAYPAYPAYPPAYAYAPYTYSPPPVPAAPPPGPQPTIDVFVGACMGGGVKASAICGYLRTRGYTDKEISASMGRCFGW